MVHSAQRSSHASHGRQRKETEARDRVVAVGSLNMHMPSGGGSEQRESKYLKGASW